MFELIRNVPGGMLLLEYRSPKYEFWALKERARTPGPILSFHMLHTLLVNHLVGVVILLGTLHSRLRQMSNGEHQDLSYPRKKNITVLQIAT